MIGPHGATTRCLALALALALALVPRQRVDASGMAVLLAPRAIWRGMEHHVSVTFAAEVSGSVQLQLQQRSGSPITSAPVQLTVGTSALLAITVPIDAPVGDYFCFATFTPYSGDASTSGSTTVNVRAGGNQLLLETDKSIYKPGNTVQLRVLSFDSALLPRSVPVTVTVTNPQGAHIMRWRDAAGEVSTEGGEALGVLALMFPLATEPVLGDYTVTAQAAGADAKTTSFLVDKYVLPTFRVEIDLHTIDGTELSASTLSTGAQELTGKISAMFTFGKPLRGAAVAVTLVQSESMDSESMDVEHSGGARVVGTAMGQTNDLGEFDFSIQLTHCADLYRSGPCIRHGWTSSTVTGMVVVTEDGTAETASAQSEPVVVSSLHDSSESSTQATITGDELLYTGQPVAFTVSAVGVSESASPVVLEVAAEFTCTEGYDSHAVEVCPEAAGSAAPLRDNNSWEAYGWCSVALDADHTKGLTLALTTADSIPGCTIDTLNIHARPAGSTSWSSRGHLSMYRAAVSLADSVLEIAKVSVTTATESLRFVVSAGWGTLGSGDVHWELIVRGDILLAGTSVADPSTGAQAVSVVATIPQQTMLRGGCQLAVHAFRPIDGSSSELVAQSLVLTAAEIQALTSVTAGMAGSASYSLAATFDRAETAPGESVAVTVAVAGSELLTQPEEVRSWLLAVDSSLHVLGSDNAIQRGQVEEALAVYTTTGPELAIPCNRKSAVDILASAGLAIAAGSSVLLSECADSTSFGRWEEGQPPIAFDDMILVDADIAVAAEAQFEAEAPLSSPSPPNAVADGDSAAAGSSSHPRTFFPETWIWDSVDVSVSAAGTGTAILNTTAPDTITSWALSSFAVSPSLGLCVGSNANVRVFKEFFVTPHLPYAATRGEILPLVVSVSNYRDMDASATVALSSGANFVVMEGGDLTRQVTG
eukprot:SAG31_NODE_3068_length_4720_cov_9.192258_3_plen_934_part_00